MKSSWLLSQSALVWGTVLASALVMVRMLVTGSDMYWFMIWNLLLAWIPYQLSQIIVKGYKTRSIPTLGLMAIGIVWLLFYPNAPYIVTDLVHLKSRDGIPLWYDAAILVLFAWYGLVIATRSLSDMQKVVRSAFGRRVSWCFVGGVALLSGVGVYLGRFLRWNSWDVFFHPAAVGQDVASRIFSPWAHPGLVAVTGVFALFFFVAYAMISFATRAGEQVARE